MTLKVIDVSEWQGVIDWAALKPNIDGAIIRCGYGDDIKSQDDERWERNVTQCERLKIPYGVYLYSYAATDNQAKSEARHALRLLEGHRPQFPVYIDLEENAQGARARKNADIFCKAIQDAGYIPGVYTFESYFNTYMGGYGKYSLWLAKFSNSKPEIDVPYDAWQYTSDGRIDGYDGRLDVSHFYRDFMKPTSTVTTSTGTASKVLEIARSQIGITNGRKYGKWYESNVDKNAANYDFGASGVPWCAMFASWVFDQAGAKCAGLPGAYCPTMLQAGIDAGKAVNPRDAKPGDVIYFDWDGGVVDHVGIVEGNTGSNLVTIEGNTDNGIVARKTRSYSCCVKAVRPDFKATAKPTFRVSYDSLGVKWLAAGKCRKGQPMRWLAVKNAGKYRVFTQRNGWLPYVTAYNVKDLESGCAGDGSPILAVEVYSSKYRYAVRKLGGGWFADMIGRTDTSGSADTFAGDKTSKLDGFRISAV